MRLLAFGTYDTRTHPRIEVLIDGLRQRGHQVVTCNAPLGIDTAGRVAMLRQPWRLPLLALRLVVCWTRLVRCARRQLLPDAVLVGYLGHFDVLLARRLYPRVPLVLDHLVGAADTARDRGSSGRTRARLLTRLDRAALSAADVIVVDTEEQRASLPVGADRAVVVPVGAGDDWFQTPGDTSTGPLRVVFFGLYTPLQGTRVIGAALTMLGDADIEITMIGVGQERAAVQGLAGDDPRVRWLDWVSPDDLPAVVADHDVCLGIFGTTPKALRVVPTKVYQGAASGCAVVTGDTAPQRRLLGDAAVFVEPGDAAALAGVLLGLVEDRDRVRHLARLAHERALRDFTAVQVVGSIADRLDAGGPRIRTREDPMTRPPMSLNAWLRWDVVERLLPDSAADVLEVGCGQGGFAARLVERYPTFVGVELDAAAAAVARERLLSSRERAEIVNAHLATLPAERRFDLVCAFEVIEHIEDDRGALEEWIGRLRPGGLLLLSTPGFPHRFAAADAMVGHFRRYDPVGLADLMRSSGLVDVDVQQFGGPLGYVLEAGRNQVGKRLVARQNDVSMADLTAGSGRLLQPASRAQSLVTEYATWPFRRLQRVVPGHGPGLVATGRLPGT